MRDFLLNISENEFFQTTNLHLHSSASDGKLDARDILMQVKALGLKNVSITDHNTVEGYKQLDFADKDINLIKGVEFDCWDGYVFMHILGYGVDINDKALLNLCAKRKCATEYDIIRIIPTRSAKNVIQTIRNAGGVAVLAHPCCMWTFDMDKTVRQLMSYGLEGIETYYPYRRHRRIIKFYDESLIFEIAQKYHLFKTGGTDFHCENLEQDFFAAQEFNLPKKDSATV